MSLYHKTDVKSLRSFSAHLLTAGAIAPRCSRRRVTRVLQPAPSGYLSNFAINNLRNKSNFSNNEHTFSLNIQEREIT